METVKRGNMYAKLCNFAYIFGKIKERLNKRLYCETHSTSTFVWLFQCTAISQSFKNFLICSYRAIIFLLFVHAKLSMSINEHLNTHYGLASKISSELHWRNYRSLEFNELNFNLNQLESNSLKWQLLNSLLFVQKNVTYYCINLLA